MANRPGEVIPAPDDDLCLGYANTRYWRGSAAPTEDLHTLDDLLRWAETTERLPPALVQRFQRSIRHLQRRDGAARDDLPLLRRHRVG